MKPNDIVQPSKMCMENIHKFKPWHRGIVLGYPDRYQAVNIKWDHKRFEVVMAGRYVELAKPEGL